MLSYLIGLLRFHTPSARPSTTEPVEQLETRRMLSVSGPGLIGERLFGSSDAVSGIELLFNAKLDPTSAQTVQNYALGRPVPKKSNGGSFLDGFVPFLRTRARGVRNGKIRFVSAIYNDSAMSVTLTPLFPFRADRFLHFLRINGHTSTGVKDTAGNLLDGNDDGQPGGDAVLSYIFRRGKSIRYSDAGGNSVLLKLRGPGRMVALLRRGNDPQPIVFLDHTSAAKSVLGGTVSPAINPATIQELVGASAAQVALATDPSFNITEMLP